MRSVFGDESQDENKQRVFTVAGIFGDSEEWKRFAGEWTSLTGGREFHAADCESDLGEFANTSHEENQKLYKDLTTILAKANFFGYCVSMELSAYREFFPNAKDPSDPYYFCFYSVVRKLTEINSHCFPLDKVEFTFDQNIDARYNAAALYDQMLQLPEWKGYDLLSDKVSFTTRKNPHVQAADLLAREGMKRLDNRIGPKRRVRRSLIALEKTNRFSFFEAGREYFRRAVEITPELRKLPCSDMDKYREWLRDKRLQENSSNLIRYHAEMMAKLQVPRQKP